MNLEEDSGDAAFRRFAEEIIGPLGRLAHALCGDRHFAEDLVQTSLIRVYQAWPRLQQPVPAAYARRTLLRCWLNEQRRGWWRAESRTGEVPDRPASDGDPADTVDGLGTREVLRRALSEVPPRQRAAVVLRYWSGYSVTETAELLRCSEGTVRSQAARGLTALRAALERLGGLDVPPAAMWSAS